MIDAVDVNEALLRQAFGCFPSGVTAFCGLLDGVAEGMAASSFTSVSLDPPLVSVCVTLTLVPPAVGPVSGETFVTVGACTPPTTILLDVPTLVPLAANTVRATR